MKKMNYRFGLLAAALAAAVMLSTGVAFAYFTDYDQLAGSARLNLSGETEIEEKVTDTSKTISVKNTGTEGENADCVVKLLIYGPEGMTVTLSSPDDWTALASEKGVYVYYYNHVLAPGESTSDVVASIDGIKKNADMADLEIIVLQESKTFAVDDNGNVAAPDGWTDFPVIKA